MNVKNPSSPRSLALLLLVSLAVARPSAAHHPHDVVTAVAVSPNFAVDRTVFAAAGGSINLFLVSRDGGYTWQESRSGMRGSSVTGIEFASDWSQSGRAWVSTKDVGIQVTTDFGRTWQAPTIMRPVQHLAVSPVRGGKALLLFATKKGVFVSTDGGKTDRKLDVPLGKAYVSCVTVSPTYWRDKTLVVGTRGNRILISRDAGATWENKQVKGPVTSVAMSAGFDSDQTMCASTWGHGVFASTDGGRSWQAFGTIGDAYVNEVAMARKKGQIAVYACTKNRGVYVSQAGQAWKHTSLRVKLTRQTDNHHRYMRLASDHQGAITAFCGTFQGLHISDDGGGAWRKANLNPTRSGRLIETSGTYAEDKTIVAAGYGMHAMISRDGGDSFGLEWAFPSWSTYSIGISPNFAKDKIIHLGMGGYLMRSEDGGRTWDWKPLPRDPEVFYGNVWSIRYAPGFGVENQSIFVLCYGGGLYRSEDAGVTWNERPVRIDASPDLVTSTPGSNNFWTVALDLSPNFAKDKTMFVVGNGLYRSTDGGKTFKRLMDGKFTRRGVLCAPDFAETGELFALTQQNGFVRLSQRGEKWEASNEGLLDYLPSRMRLSPAYARDNSITVTTYGGGVFQSLDRGKSWKRISPFPSPVDNGLSLAVSPSFETDKTLFVGSYAGFYRSQDNGKTWGIVSDFEVYDDFREPWEWHGEWKRERVAGSLNLEVNYNLAAYSWAELPFEGKGVRLLGSKGPDHGMLELWLDGKLIDVVDAYAPKLQSGMTLFERAGLRQGYHHLEVRVSPKRNPKSKSSRIGIDAAHVTLR